MLARLALIVPFLAACGGSDDNPAIDAPAGSDAPADMPVDMPPTGFTLTSTMLQANGSFAAINTCSSAENQSPQLSWVNAPAGSMSFAVVLTDLDFNGLLHWVIWDIPAATTSLPEAIEKVFQPGNVAGAKQTLSTVDNKTRGYMGPCPPFPDTHHYQLDVYGVDEATLSGVAMSSTASAVLVQITNHDTGRASLPATYKQP